MLAHFLRECVRLSQYSVSTHPIAKCDADLHGMQAGLLSAAHHIARMYLLRRVWVDLLQHPFKVLQGAVVDHADLHNMEA